MRINPYYRLKYLAGVPYLLTHGQGNAEFRKDIQLNETSVFLWEQLAGVSDTEELVTRCIEHFQCPQEQYPLIRDSVRAFVSSLYREGILLPEINDAANIVYYKTLEIAGAFLRLYGEEGVFAPELLSFAVSGEVCDDAPVQDIFVQTGAPAQTENGRLLLRNEDLWVIEGTHHYILFFPAFRQILEARVCKDGSRGTIFCKQKVNAEGVQEISYIIRIFFLLFAQKQGKVAVHSASILYREKLWLFSAPSGIGKSTHAQLWQDIYRTAIINGDLNLISLKQGEPVVEGIPWCGTSGIYSGDTYPLGGIIFLRQGGDNRITELSGNEKVLRILHRCISPAWTEAMQESNIQIIEQLYDKILLCHLTCNKEKEAVYCIKQSIDAYLDDYNNFVRILTNA